jgi:rubrerythrin
MATFICSHCGFEKDGKCKPQTCPGCGDKKCFEKKESKA